VHRDAAQQLGAVGRGRAVRLLLLSTGLFCADRRSRRPRRISRLWPVPGDLVNPGRPPACQRGRLLVLDGRRVPGRGGLRPAGAANRWRDDRGRAGESDRGQVRGDVFLRGHQGTECVIEMLDRLCQRGDADAAGRLMPDRRQPGEGAAQPVGRGRELTDRKLVRGPSQLRAEVLDQAHQRVAT
jgi:hypothetical protein